MVSLGCRAFGQRLFLIFGVRSLLSDQSCFPGSWPLGNWEFLRRKGRAGCFVLTWKPKLVSECSGCCLDHWQPQELADCTGILRPVVGLGGVQLRPGVCCLDSRGDHHHKCQWVTWQRPSERGAPCEWSGGKDQREGQVVRIWLPAPSEFARALRLSAGCVPLGQCPPSTEHSPV